MKRLCVRFSVLLFLLSTGSLYALDFFAMQSAVEQLEFRLTRGSSAAVVSITSPSQQLSEQVLNELNARMVNVGVTMITRERVTLVLEEAGLNLFNSIGDAAMRSVGRELNVQAVISVEVDDMRDHYQMRFKMMNVETAAILSQPIFSINKNRGRRVRQANMPRLNTIGVMVTNIPYGNERFLHFDNENSTNRIIGAASVTGTATSPIVTGVAISDTQTSLPMWRFTGRSWQRFTGTQSVSGHLKITNSSTGTAGRPISGGWNLHRELQLSISFTNGNATVSWQ